MARIRFYGLEEYEKKLSKLSAGSEAMADKAICAGAGIITDKIRQNISMIPRVSGVTADGLRDGLGITPLKNDNGFLNRKIGFDGYNAKGEANQKMARMFNSGTSKIRKTPFITSAVSATRKVAEEEMARVLEEEIEKAMK